MLQDIVALLLDVVEEEAEAAVVGIDPFNARQPKSLVCLARAEEVHNVVDPAGAEQGIMGWEGLVLTTVIAHE